VFARSKREYRVFERLCWIELNELDGESECHLMWIGAIQQREFAFNGVSRPVHPNVGGVKLQVGTGLT
jgi:hypothetical protein